MLFILDADLTVPPEDLPKFLRPIATGKAGFVNGTRLVYPLEDEAMRTVNLFGNKFFSLVFTWLLDQRIKDTLCGTKVLRKRDYDDLAANRGYFGDFDPFGDFDLLFGAARLGLPLVEVAGALPPAHLGAIQGAGLQARAAAAADERYRLPAPEAAALDREQGPPPAQVMPSPLTLGLFALAAVAWPLSLARPGWTGEWRRSLARHRWRWGALLAGLLLVGAADPILPRVPGLALAQGWASLALPELGRRIVPPLLGVAVLALPVLADARLRPGGLPVAGAGGGALPARRRGVGGDRPGPAADRPRGGGGLDDHPRR